ncbi:MAG: PEP-CTERM sorting domain-containing protein [Planctomycetota bacterium]
MTTAADLDLARVRYAANVGGSDDQTVGGVHFEADADGDAQPAGYAVSSQHVAMNWAQPAVADPALAEVLDDIRWTGGGAVTQSFAGLTPDRSVQVQVLLCESHHSQPGSRPIDVTIEGRKRWDDLDPLALWGRHGAGVATAYARVGPDGVLDIAYTADSGPDRNPIVNGIVVSDVPGQAIDPVAVTASAEYQPLPKFPASAVLDGSWEDKHPALHGGATADYWLLPDGQTGYLQFDLGGEWNLEFIDIHNTNNSQWGDRGTVAYHLDISPTDTFEVFETIAAGTLPTWQEGWLSRPVSTDKFWRYARFYVDDFGGTMGADGGGLAEIGFYGRLPEPGTLALLGVGLFALARRRRRY